MKELIDRASSGLRPALGVSAILGAASGAIVSSLTILIAFLPFDLSDPYLLIGLTYLLYFLSIGFVLSAILGAIFGMFGGLFGYMGGWWSPAKRGWGAIVGAVLLASAFPLLVALGSGFTMVWWCLGQGCPGTM